MVTPWGWVMVGATRREKVKQCILVLTGLYITYIYIYLYMYTWIFQCRISAFWLACMDEEVAILHSWKIQVYLGSVLLPVVAVRKQLSCY